MRKFTKDHNKLSWLYPAPSVSVKDPEVYGEECFKEYEEMAKDLCEECYGVKRFLFEKEDMLDAFMKGTSVAHQMLSGEICQEMQQSQISKDTYKSFSRYFDIALGLLEKGLVEEAKELFKCSKDLLEARVRIF